MPIFCSTSFCFCTASVARSFMFTYIGCGITANVKMAVNTEPLPKETVPLAQRGLRSASANVPDKNLPGQSKLRLQLRNKTSAPITDRHFETQFAKPPLPFIQQLTWKNAPKATQHKFCDVATTSRSTLVSTLNATNLARPCCGALLGGTKRKLFCEEGIFAMLKESTVEQ